MGEIEEIAPGQFKCRYCEKTFDRIFSVHRHERVHTGFKPCVCKACGRGFSEKRNLRHHIIRFHSDGTGRELLKRNRNKSAAAAAAAAHAQAQAKQQIKQLSAAATFLQNQQQLHKSSSSQNSTGTSSPPSSNASSPQHHSIHSQHQNSSLIDTQQQQHQQRQHQQRQQHQHQHQHQHQQQTDSLLSNQNSANNLISAAASSQITATLNRLQQGLKNESIDMSGLSALGAAAAVITVSSSSSLSSSSSSSRRRKSKPSKKINY